MDQPVAVVKAGELRAGMTILEITKFDSKFSCLDSETLQYLKGEFDGAMAVVLRDDAKKTLPMADLKLFDDVTAITNLPGDSRFGQVVAGLGEKLESQGYFEFKVSGSGSVATEPAPPPPPAAPPQKTRAPTKSSDSKHLARLDQARAILEKVGVAIENREEATSRIEEMMDQGRAGKISAKGAVESVEKMLGDGATSAMKALAGLKASDQTYAHCVDVAIIFQESYADMLVDTGRTPSSESAKTILVAGLLHDIGKSRVPKEILDSKTRFAPDSEEMKIIRKHPIFSLEILSKMGMSKSIINVAAYHHVKKDTTLPSSYPDVRFEQVMAVTRLGAIVDVYQALIGSRSYKPNWVPGKAVELLMKLKGTEFDERALGFFLRSNGIYPTGSLVRLSTGDLAFVIKNEKDSLENPVISIVEDSQGHLLSHHDLIDLVVEEDLSITEVVDHYRHYDQSDDHAFQVFKSINPN